MNKLYQGDCLDVLPKIKKESVDLIYLDPPYNSNKDYGEFNDKWKSSEEYIKYLEDRLLLMRQCLKPTGSIYLHCDNTESHYIKIIMDKIFGRNNFKNEIIWWYPGGLKNIKNVFADKHDTIFFYTKSNKHTFNLQRNDFSNEVSLWKRWGKYSSDKKTVKLKEIPITDTINRARQINKFKNKYKKDPLPNDVLYTKEGALIESVWNDCSSVYRKKENVRYPTQKPLALLERIIKASSNKNDAILDPFMGSGTTLVAASTLKRKFIGIDMSDIAIKVSKKRLDKNNVMYKVIK